MTIIFHIITVAVLQKCMRVCMLNNHILGLFLYNYYYNIIIFIIVANNCQ